MTAERIAEVNEVLKTILNPGQKREWQLYRRHDHRLRLRLWGTFGFDVDPAIRDDGLWFANIRRRETGWGGTQEQAIVQLVRWCRDLPRRPLAFWRYISGPGVALGGPPLLEAITRSSYFADPTKTACVLCGKPNVNGWWSLDKVTGPACRHATSDGCRS